MDMDAFYASVELLRYPQLKGLPVVIGGSRRRGEVYLERLKLIDPTRDWIHTPLSEYPIEVFPRLSSYTGRGVITTATYVARQFGIGSAMGLMKAAQLCPHAILLPVDFDEYRKYSRLFKSIILQIAPVMQDRGIDEVYLDFTHIPGGQREGGRVLARLIQKSIFEATRLTCSIGVAPNKLLAKMASEFNKPNGIFILNENDIESQIWPLACRKINGIGPKGEARLKALGIHTIGDLANTEVALLVKHFGKNYGQWLRQAAMGIDDSAVQTFSEPVSLSRETTFDQDLSVKTDKLRLGAVFTRLCEQVASDLQRKGYLGKTVGIKLKYEDFKTVTRDHTIDNPTADPVVIRRVAGQLLKRVDLNKRIRLLGVRMGSLNKTHAPVKASNEQEWGDEKSALGDTQAQREEFLNKPQTQLDRGFNQELF